MNLASILKKVAMAITGLGLFFFVIAHLSGNLLMLGGADPFNAYAARLHSLGPLLWAAEIGLVGMFKFGDTSGEDGLFGLVIRTFQNPGLVALGFAALPIWSYVRW